MTSLAKVKAYQRSTSCDSRLRVDEERVGEQEQDDKGCNCLSHRASEVLLGQVVESKLTRLSV